MPIEKRWVVKPQGNPEAVAAMAAATGISPVLANLLVQRGIDTLEKAKKFFNPQLSDLHDPFLMKDMDKAVERVERAVRNREKIMVYGDYDVDGTTAVALVYKFLRQIGQNDQAHDHEREVFRRTKAQCERGKRWCQQHESDDGQGACDK